MRRSASIGSIAVVLAAAEIAGALHAKSAMPEPLQLETKIPLGKVVGRLDHMAIDLARRRLFVTELGNNSVGVIDLATSTIVHRIYGLSEPQGVAYIRSTDSLYVANGGDGSVRIFRGAKYAPIASISLDADADNVRFDSTGDRLLVGYGKGGLAVIDPAVNRKIANYALSAHPESFQIDFKADRIFVNVPSTRAIVVLDRTSGRELARWRMRHSANFAMALDNKQQRVLVAFRRPARLAAFSRTTGEVLGEADTCRDSDDLFPDPKRRRIYVSCGDGFVDVFDSRDRTFRRRAHLRSGEGARTSLFTTELDRLFVAVRARSREPAAIWVYRPVP